MIHTVDESPQDGLRNVQTYKTILAYVLYHLSTTWLQFQKIGRSLR